MPFGQPLIHKVTLNSTNTFLKHLAGKGVPEGTLVWADSQTGGRGRYGREWHSPKGNLYASLLLKPLKRSDESIPQISLLAGIAMAETLEKVFHRNFPHPQIGLKWPNDIYLNRKKCGGLLCEIEPIHRDEPCVIAGLGLNVNCRTFPPALSHATSLSAETGKKFDLSHLLLEWCSIFQELYEIWQREGFASSQK
ncbi:MAG: biotin--[acetyl-CoA-carboxylase] ligase, partial [Deltaproteobacteria bacterium]|nr:biotin--[acetyl-CoA-carboxylase] ligase [Deltaproteobacteria bacterium]